MIPLPDYFALSRIVLASPIAPHVAAACVVGMSAWIAYVGARNAVRRAPAGEYPALDPEIPKA